ncbi:DUF4115 domain-containing protein [bacterium]|nr:DUF4115 domain-containing protein [bacterium]
MESIGKILKKARLEKKLRIQDIYAQIKIDTAYLKALEGDAFNIMPSPEYVRIFLKGYANFLGLDTEKLLAQHDQCSRPSPSHKVKNIDKKTKKKILLFSIIGLTLILLIAGISIVRYFVNTVNNISIEEEGDNSVQNIPVLPLADMADSALITDDAGLIIPVFVDTGIIDAIDSSVEKISDSLELKFSAIDKTWIKIFADGKKLFEGTLYEGDEKVLYAKEKFHFRIGNAGGVAIQLNGEIMPILGKKGQVIGNVVVTKDGIHTQ